MRIFRLKFWMVGALLVLGVAPWLRAEDAVKWGQPVNGLRLGLESAVTTATVDEKLTFTVSAQNVSSQPITLPTPETFLLKDRDDSDDYHATPLAPIIQSPTETGKDPFVGGTATYSMGPSGVPVGLAPPKVVTIAPGATIAWDSIPLEEHIYDGSRMPSGGKTTVQQWILLPEHTARILFRFENQQKQVAGKSVWTGKADSGAIDMKIQPASLGDIKVEGAFTLPKQTFFLGEPILATLTVTNKGTQTFEYPNGGDYRGTGRHDRFTIHAVDAQGQAVPDPITPSGMGGGLGSDYQVKPGESHTEDLLVNHWCAFSKPGKYTVTCKRTLNIMRADQGLGNEETLPTVPVETTFTIDLVDNPAALKAYLANFVPTLLRASAENHLPPAQRTQVSTGTMVEELECMALAQNPAAVPILEQLLDNPDFQGQAVDWLSQYPSDQVAPLLLSRFATFTPQAKVNALGALTRWKTPAAEPLIAASLSDPDENLRMFALSLCINQRHESCTPILLAMGDDPKREIRYYRAEALGTSGDPKAIPILLKLLHDADLETQISAAVALGKLKRMEGVPVLIELLRDPKARVSGYDLQSALWQITGENPGPRYTDWLTWWEKTGKGKYGR